MGIWRCVSEAWYSYENTRGLITLSCHVLLTYEGLYKVLQRSKNTADNCCDACHGALRFVLPYIV